MANISSMKTVKKGSPNPTLKDTPKMSNKNAIKKAKKSPKVDKTNNEINSLKLEEVKDSIKDTSKIVETSDKKQKKTKMPKKEKATSENSSQDEEMSCDEQEDSSTSEKETEKKQKGETKKASPSPNKPALVKYDHQLFVGQIDHQANEDVVREHFSQFGEVLNVAMPKFKNSTKNKGFAFVAFAEASTKQAVMAEKEHKIHSMVVRVAECTDKQMGVGDETEPQKRKREDDSTSESPAKKKKDNKGASRPIFEHSLFVGGISYKAKREKLMSYFSKFGEVLDINLPMNFRNVDENKGFCFVSFATADGKNKTLQKKKHEINNRVLKIQERKKIVPDKKSKKAVADDDNKLFVANLDRSTKRKAISDYFSKFGKVSSVILPFFNQKKRNKGYCHVTFEDRATVLAVLGEKHELDGSVLDVQPTEIKKSKSTEDDLDQSASDDNEDDDDDEEDDDEEEDDGEEEDDEEDDDGKEDDDEKEDENEMSDDVEGEEEDSDDEE